MTDRLQRHLDGELSEHDLTADERSAAREFRDALQLARDAIPDDPAPDLVSAVLARISMPATPDRPHHGAASTWTRRVLHTLWRPRAVTVRPAFAGGALAMVVAAFVWLLDPTGSSTAGTGAPVQHGGTAVVAGSADKPGSLVRFRLDAPAAASVSLAGGFTEWQPSIGMIEETPGVWTAVVPLEPGVYDYAFVIDGHEWVVDPMAQHVDDGFGGQNSRIAVLVGAGQS